MIFQWIKKYSERNSDAFTHLHDRRVFRGANLIVDGNHYSHADNDRLPFDLSMGNSFSGTPFIPVEFIPVPNQVQRS